MILHAYAKINLALDVLGRRPNGYHDVKMIMQSIGVYDEITIDKNSSGEITIICDDDRLPCDKSNLIYKAARSILDYCNCSEGVDISLKKNIPMAAGLAGGSADAAATLIGVNALLNLGLDNVTLREIGVKLGADIPFCIEGGTYLSEGIGELLTKLPDTPDCHLVIAKPDIDVSTKFVYENLKLDDSTVHPDVDSAIAGIERGDLGTVIANMANLLETVTADAYPVIHSIEQILLSEGAMGAMMSGSGPTVFGIFDKESTASSALNALLLQYPDIDGHVTRLSRQGVIQIDK